MYAVVILAALLHVAIARPAEDLRAMLAVYERSLRVMPPGLADDGTDAPQRFFSVHDSGEGDILKFDLDVGEKSSLLVMGMLRMRWNVRSAHVGTLRLHQLLGPPGTDMMLIYHEDMVFERGSREIEVNISSAAETWLEKSENNFGLKLECVGCKGRRESTVLDLLVQLDTPRAKRFRELERQPTSTKCQPGACCREPLWVSFKDIGWDWVVKPEGFDAGVCRGRCTRDNPVSTHAHILNLLRQRGEPSDLPESHCVPGRLQPLNLLHKDGDKYVVTRQRGMVVEDCACS